MNIGPEWPKRPRKPELALLLWPILRQRLAEAGNDDARLNQIPIARVPLRAFEVTARGLATANWPGIGRPRVARRRRDTSAELLLDQLRPGGLIPDSSGDASHKLIQPDGLRQKAVGAWQPASMGALSYAGADGVLHGSLVLGDVDSLAVIRRLHAVERGGAAAR